MPHITCERALSATQEALALALADTQAPVAFCITDGSGSLLAFARMDGAAERLVAIAISKAYTAARMRASTLAFKQRMEKENLTLADFCDPALTSLPGGLPLMSKAQCWGAVGVSGRTLLEDAALAERFAALVRAKAYD